MSYLLSLRERIEVRVNSSTHPSARFRAELSDLIEGHSILHRAQAEIWQDGLYLGNGDMAATVYGAPEATSILLNKGDIWDERADRLDHAHNPDDFDWQHLKDVMTRCIESGDWTEYDELPRPEAWAPDGDLGNYPAFHPAGILEVRGGAVAGYSDFRQSLSLYRATVDCAFRHGGHELGYSAYVHADHNLLAMDIRGDDTGWPLAITLHRNLTPFSPKWTGDPAFAAPEFGHDADTMWHTMVFPDGFAYAVVVQAPDLASESELAEDSVTTRLSDGHRSVVSVRLTIVTGQDARPFDLVAQGKQDLASILATPDLEQSHTKWWADFWRKGWISLPDKLVENLWYVEIYKMAACSRKGGQAPGQLAHWSGYPDPPWRGDYHTNVNVQENYWPIYTANRPELGWPFYDLYLGMLDYMIEDTLRFTGQPGARFVRGHGRSGRPSRKYRSPDSELWPGGGAWVSAAFWWHYQFTRDEEFLATAYPMFKACTDYIVAYLGEPNADGTYNVIPSVAHEQSVRPPVPGVGGDFGKNSPYDLGILKEHLVRTIKASEVLGMDDALRDGWRHVLDNLAPYPVGSGGFLQDWEGIEMETSHRHLSPLYSIYPGEEVHQGSTVERAEMGRRSVRSWIERGSDAYTGFSFGWLAAAAARMGMADEALAAIHDHIRAFVNVNGYSLIGPSLTPGLAPYMANRGPDWETKLPNCESGSCFGAGINELLLCSPSGNLASEPVIRVFPAVTGEWHDVRMSRLRAQGAFLVTAERRNSRTSYVLLESEVGAECSLVNPWPSQEVVVKDGRGRFVTHRSDDDVISFPTVAGDTYVVLVAGGDLNDFEIVDLADADDNRRLGIGGPFATERAP